jgi:hypothetical protein
MRSEELTALIRRRPYLPLRIHLTDGRTYDVRHPDQIIVLRGALDIGVEPDPQSGVVDRVDRVSLLHVVRVEEFDSQSAPGIIER